MRAPGRRNLLSIWPNDNITGFVIGWFFLIDWLRKDRVPGGQYPTH